MNWEMFCNFGHCYSEPTEAEVVALVDALQNMAVPDVVHMLNTTLLHVYAFGLSNRSSCETLWAVLLMNPRAAPVALAVLNTLGISVQDLSIGSRWLGGGWVWTGTVDGYGHFYLQQVDSYADACAKLAAVDNVRAALS
jgi:hypothetical protein